MDKAQKHWERIQQKKKREAEQISAAIVKRDAWIMDAAECLVCQFRRQENLLWILEQHFGR